MAESSIKAKFFAGKHKHLGVRPMPKPANHQVKHEEVKNELIKTHGDKSETAAVQAKVEGFEQSKTGAKKGEETVMKKMAAKFYPSMAGDKT